MPFVVNKAAVYTRRVVIPMPRYDQSVTVHYNAGQKYRQYQIAGQKINQDYNDLSVRMTAISQETDEKPEKAARVSQETYEELKKAMNGARRRLADNLCTVIEDWDLEVNGDYNLDSIKANMSAQDKKRYPDITGTGKIPIAGAWLDALPLPDEFVIAIADGIAEDFDSGGEQGKEQ